jgi:predicted nucleic acid-binding protein
MILVDTDRTTFLSGDLKIAATALVNDALLLSANLTEFERVPRLRVDNWLD